MLDSIGDLDDGEKETESADRVGELLVLHWFGPACGQCVCIRTNHTIGAVLHCLAGLAC